MMCEDIQKSAKRNKWTNGFLQTSGSQEFERFWTDTYIYIEIPNLIE